MRDLKADLELCNKATPGPWVICDWDTDVCGGIIAPDTQEVVIEAEDWDMPVKVKREDAEFMCQAREGWPHAIERAIKAETLVNELRSDSKTDYGELCDYCPSRERCRLQNFGTCMYGDFDQKEQKGRNPGGEEGMNINIDIMDFVSEEEVREAVLDGIRHSVIKTYSGDEENMNRLVSNLSYEFVYQMVDEQFDNKLTETLKAKFDEVRDGILDVVFECVMGKLFSGGEKNA